MKYGSNGYHIRIRRIEKIRQDKFSGRTHVLSRILILTNHAFLFAISDKNFSQNNPIYNKILGRILNKSVYDPITRTLIANTNTQITPNLIQKLPLKLLKGSWDDL